VLSAGLHALPWPAGMLWLFTKYHNLTGSPSVNIPANRQNRSLLASVTSGGVEAHSALQQYRSQQPTASNNFFQPQLGFATRSCLQSAIHLLHPYLPPHPSPKQLGPPAW